MKIGILADAHGNVEAVPTALDPLHGRVERLLMVCDAIN